MRKYIVATHSYLSKGIADALELIVGTQEHLTYFCAYTELSKNLYEEVQEEISHYPTGTEIIIMTDLFGGSVNNELTRLIELNDNIHLVTGTNLGLAMSIVLSPENTKIEDVIEMSIDEAKKGIIYINEQVKNENEEGLDDF